MERLRSRLAHPVLRRATAGLLGAAFLVYVVRALLDPWGASFETPLYDALIIAAPLACLARAIAQPADRLAWALVTGGLVAWAAGDVYDTSVLSQLAEPPYPSLADAGWLAFYPACYVAVVLLAAPRGTPIPSGVWLDGVLTALACAALAAALLFEPILSTAVDGAAPVIITNLAYPICDLTLIALVIAVLGLTGWRPGRMWLLLAAGLVVSAIADSIYLSETAKETYVEGGLLDAMWPLSVLLITWAAWQPRRARALRLEGVRIVAVPVAAALTALALLFVDHFARVNTVALILATATLGIAVIRMGLAFAANARMLARSRHEAVTDALTGLGNRRALMDDLKRPMDADDALVLFDLDGFKRYNDTFGHPAGDGLLRRLGGKLTRAVEGHGHAYRMGGDEFCVLLHCPAAQHEAVIARVAVALSESGRGFEIGASQGVVVPALEAATAAEALQIADRRMYDHKADRSMGRTSEAADVVLPAAA
jgi:two-component system cell cycle response regulator